MTATVPTTEPMELRAGLTWAWRREGLTDYPASAWTLKYWFKRMGLPPANFSIVCTADGDTHVAGVTATISAAYGAGNYTWVALATQGSNAYEIGRGLTKLLPRYDQVGNLDDRTHARRVLEAIEAVIEGRATLDQQEYTIGNRNLKRMPIADLLVLRDRYRTEVANQDAAERAAAGLGDSRNTFIRFNRV